MITNNTINFIGSSPIRNFFAREYANGYRAGVAGDAYTGASHVGHLGWHDGLLRSHERHIFLLGC